MSKFGQPRRINIPLGVILLVLLAAPLFFSIRELINSHDGSDEYAESGFDLKPASGISYHVSV